SRNLGLDQALQAARRHSPCHRVPAIAGIVQSISAATSMLTLAIPGGDTEPPERPGPHQSTTLFIVACRRGWVSILTYASTGGSPHPPHPLGSRVVSAAGWIPGPAGGNGGPADRDAGAGAGYPRFSAGRSDCPAGGLPGSAAGAEKADVG